eukprot:1195153-Prorocentrum_minimum.AAC.5
MARRGTAGALDLCGIGLQVGKHSRRRYRRHQTQANRYTTLLGRFCNGENLFTSLSWCDQVPENLPIWQEGSYLFTPEGNSCTHSAGSVRLTEVALCTP